jgi:hypothetical protein
MREHFFRPCMGEVRCYQTISDPAHVNAAQLLRQQRLAVVPPAAETEVEQRRLADYDTALGVAGFEGSVTW